MRDDRPMERTAGMVTGLVPGGARGGACRPGPDLARGDARAESGRMRDDRPMERTAGMVTGLVAVKRARASLPGQDLPRAAESAFREAGSPRNP